MFRIGIIGKYREERVIAIVKLLIKWLEDRGIEYFVEEALVQSFDQLKGIPREEIPKKADLLVVLGGDGTLLSAVRLVSESEIPILGVNAGGLGFLTEITVDELFQVLEEVIKGNYEITQRCLLRADVYRKGNRSTLDELKIKEQNVLNDVVINKGALARIIDLHTYIGGDYVTTYKADGLIISTPSGSTAYSLSAGGPIVYPSLNSILITPICPHTLTNRPLLIPDDLTVMVNIGSRDGEVYLTLDGQVGIALENGDSVCVKKAERMVNFIRSRHRKYFEVLRTKLRWGER
jgi:NAD+ kinase